jgi:hypothetical protein
LTSESTKRIIFVRYKDHVLYNMTSTLALKPQIREAIGWLLYDCSEYLILCWDTDADPPTLHSGDQKKASGLVLLKSTVLELRKLEVKSSERLNLQETILENEFALQPKERKTQKEGEN